ncbi:DUF1810 domain-containing protein [Frigoribacterium sp. VKM Ac-2836]|uniref:DUF1810 domain-containing protein n=1 Tax=Frigoribacterium sp. VKM Ac-2836 TaxID=2739014 RepID=UPI001564AF70|nr:DUF1810 domain-containing protein [Frigoribacterium sp. VKM Ac-2836]NRD26596.1 DUF1810 domain-containing protein [Frigoribacterium sp. VKM Ac-2836]
MSHAFDLERYVDAQDVRNTHDQALAELRRGRKSSHWMWFVFPQIAGLGRSGMDRTYAIRSLDEARAYLAHPVLGPRLREAAQVTARADAESAEALMGGIDALKLRSSMTLFGRADPAEPAFRAVLERWFDGVEDDLTVARL